jgi:hypothetical protein
MRNTTAVLSLAYCASPNLGVLGSPVGDSPFLSGDGVEEGSLKAGLNLDLAYKECQTYYSTGLLGPTLGEKNDLFRRRREPKNEGGKGDKGGISPEGGRDRRKI